MKVLVIQNAKLGDMVCTTPVFKAIKRKYPNWFLVVVGNKLNQDLLAGNPNVDLYLLSEDLEEYLKTVKVDVAIMTSPSPTHLWKLIKSRTRKIIVPKIVGGFSPYATKKYKLLSLLVTKTPHHIGCYAPQEYLNMLRPLGIFTNDTKKEVFISREAENFAESLLKKHQGKRLVAIAPGVGNKIKEWPPERFNEVARWLIDTRDTVVVLIGAKQDVELSKIVKRGLDDVSMEDTTDRLSVDKLKAVIKKMDLFISADTGPIYIAEACGVPTVDIVGPMDENEQPPRGKYNRVVTPRREKPELHIMNARMYDVGEARKQVEEISTEMVITEVKSLIDATSHHEYRQ